MNRYLEHQYAVLRPFLRRGITLLDFGCGDMELDRLIVRRIPSIQVRGIDVVHSHPKTEKNMKFTIYDGTTIPYRSRTFDRVYAYHVFHHCADPEAALMECRRVTKGRICIVESVLRSTWEIPGFMLVDFLANIGRRVHIPMPFHVHTGRWWKKLFARLHLTVVEERSVGVFPSWLPIGKTTVFILEIKKRASHS